MRRVLQITPGDVEFGGVEMLLMNQLKAVDSDRLVYDFWIPGKIKNRSFAVNVLNCGSKIYENNLEKKGKIYYWLFWKKINGFLMDCDYDTVQITTGSVLTMSICLFAMKRNGIANRITYCQNSGSPYMSFGKKLINGTLKRYISKNASWLLYPSKDACFWGFGKEKNDGRYKMLFNAIDVDRFTYSEDYRTELRKSYNVKPDEYIVGNIGRFEKQKNHNFIVELFFQLKKRCPEARLLLIGNGSLEPEIKRKLADRGIFNTIFVDSTLECYKFYSMMDVFLFPSFYEGLGIVSVEAQCNGLPVVMSKGVPEEAIVLENIVRLDLREPIEKWVEKTIFCKRVDSNTAKTKLICSNYSIKELIEELYRIYDV